MEYHCRELVFTLREPKVLGINFDVLYHICTNLQLYKGLGVYFVTILLNRNIKYCNVN